MFSLETPESRAAERAEREAQFPGAIYQDPSDVSSFMQQRLVDALRDGREETIHGILAQFPYLIQYGIERSGHHGVWAFSKPMIKAPSPTQSGLIPDFLVATKNSLGYFWHIVELKRPSVQFASADGKGLSTEGHRALTQCLGYRSHFQDYIDHVRTLSQINLLAQPQDVILVIGDSERETQAQTRVRTQHQQEGRLTIITYRRLLAGVEEDLKFRRGYTRADATDEN